VFLTFLIFLLPLETGLNGITLSFLVLRLLKGGDSFGTPFLPLLASFAQNGQNRSLNPGARWHDEAMTPHSGFLLAGIKTRGPVQNPVKSAEMTTLPRVHRAHMTVHGDSMRRGAPTKGPGRHIHLLCGVAWYPGGYSPALLLFSGYPGDLFNLF